MCDNSTAVAYINKKGGIKSDLCDILAKDIWVWCYNKNIHISAAHIPGSENIAADFLSRNFNDNHEWQLNPIIFSEISLLFGNPSIDLFASRLNQQVSKYVAWKPDPNAFAVDAFSISWKNEYIYLFPPFSLILQVLQKIIRDQAKGILIVPDWPAQVWFPQLMKLKSKIKTIPPHANNLILSHKPDLVHPLAEKMILKAVHFNSIISN